MKKTMMSVFTGVVFAAVTTSAVAGFAQSAREVEGNAPARTAPATTTLKGTIKTIDDSSIVVTTPEKKDATFQLTSSVKRTGTLTPGSQVAVTYYFDNGQHVVTAVAGAASTAKNAGK
jgi:hypothetical protein